MSVGMLLLSSSVWVSAGSGAGSTPSVPSLTHSNSIDAFQPLLEEHCLKCHGPKKQKGAFRVDQLTSDFTDHSNATAWMEVRNQLQLGEMPPEDETRPAVADVIELSEWVAQGLRDAERVALGAGSDARLRRLNRTEFTHTVADLLQMRFPAGESPMEFLPPDGTAEGFDKVGAALWIDPSLMATYYEVASRIAERAIVEGPPEYPTERMRLEFEDIPDSGAIGYLVTRLGLQPVQDGLQLVEGNTRSYGMLRYPGRNDNNVAPVNGFYRFTLKAGALPGVNGEWPRVKIEHKHPSSAMETILETDITAPWDNPALYSVELPRDTLGAEIEVRILNGPRLYMSQKPGEHFMRRIDELGEKSKFGETIRLAGRKISEGWGGDRSTPDPDLLDLTQFPRVFLDYLEVEGPLYEAWPPLSHQELIGESDPEVSGISEIKSSLMRFLPKAWRGPVQREDIKPILNVASDELDAGGSYLEAMRSALTASLLSPRFLYLALPGNQNRDLNDYELASRLSYFLWNSMPDQRLLDLAASGLLNQPEILTSEVNRMLKNPKSVRFVDGFARQWMKVDTFLAFTPDQRLYREYDESLGQDFMREPLEFFKHVLQQDKSLMSFIDSEFLLLNRRLADFYGIQTESKSLLSEKEFTPVQLTESSPRGGLLGMAGIHLAGSDGQRTKPVARAVYVRDVFFNDPPDPPPPNVGEIEPNVRGENLTVRDRLLQHQELETCAACHRGLDPYGLALENFNVIGAWREKQDGENFRGSGAPEIRVDGKLPNGKAFHDFESYKALLIEQGDRLRRGLAEKMLVYAIGRPVGPGDDPWLQKTTEALREGEDSLRSLIHQLVQSPQFKTR